MLLLQFSQVYYICSPIWASQYMKMNCMTGELTPWVVNRKSVPVFYLDCVTCNGRITAQPVTQHKSFRLVYKTSSLLEVKHHLHHGCTAVAMDALLMGKMPRSYRFRYSMKLCKGVLGWGMHWNAFQAWLINNLTMQPCIIEYMYMTGTLTENKKN